jgi:hypothetical protein
MNWRALHDNWGQFQAVLWTHWPELTNRELDAIDGRRERLAETLRNHHGCSQAEAERRIAAFEKDMRCLGAVY